LTSVYEDFWCPIKVVYVSIRFFFSYRMQKLRKKMLLPKRFTPDAFALSTNQIIPKAAKGKKGILQVGKVHPAPTAARFTLWK
jgi:hypothetical protein